MASHCFQKEAINTGGHPLAVQNKLHVKASEKGKALIFKNIKAFSCLFVLGAGLEPAQPLWSQDFKSCVSTIPPSERTFSSRWDVQMSLTNKLKRAEDETRTRDPNLGKVVLYQLSYFRNMLLCQIKCSLAQFEIATANV